MEVSVPVVPASAVQYKFCVNGCSQAADWRVDPNPSVPQVEDGQGGKNSQRTDTTCSETVCDEPALPPPGVYDWRDAVLYFVFVDRFFDGKPQNNCTVANVSGAPSQYQGGDWEGVRQKIQSGYFTDLGVNTLWITVPANNTDQSGKGAGGDTKRYWLITDIGPPSSIDFRPRAALAPPRSCTR